METEVLKRQLKVYCPTHQTVFEVEGKPQIICEIKEHALSNDFPQSEFWEFCADCQTFSPSNFGIGDKAADVCRHCERTTVRRFLCDECKIISVDSDEDTKGKIFTIGAESIKPHCPGCQKVFGETFANLHQCKDIKNSLMTHRAECPFCQKLTFEKASSPQQVEKIQNVNVTTEMPNNAGSTQCPSCGHWGFAGRAHCGKCGTRINKLGEGVLPGTTAPRTQLLGSICPNCGTGNQAESLFCNNCGQALKVKPLFQTGNLNAPPNFPYQTGNLNPPPPNLPPPPPIPNAQNDISIGAQTLSPTEPLLQNNSNGSKNPLLIVVGGLLFVFCILGLIAYNANKSNMPQNNSSGSKSSTNMTRIKEAKVVNKDLKIRSYASPNAPEVGILYMNTKVNILEEGQSDTGTLWYRIKVVEYGCSRDVSLGCGKDNPNDKDEGWAYSEYIRY